MTRVFWIAALGVATVLLVGCNRSSADASSARLKVNGQVQLDTARQLFQLSKGTRTVHYGDRIKVLSGSAVLERSDGGSLELRRGSELRFGPHPALLAGAALGIAGDSPMVVDAAGSELSIDSGAARLTRTLAVSAASYRGSLTINSVGRALTVPALREASVATAGVVPAHANPIAYNADDAWDRRYLGVAIELADQLQARSDGLTASLHSDDGRSVGFYRTVLPALSHEGQFAQTLLQVSRQPGETLVGATLVQLGHTGTFAERWSQAFAFRDAGADWGLVALDQGVTDVQKVTGDLDAAIGRAPLLLAAPAPLVAQPVAPLTEVAAPAPLKAAPAPITRTVPAPSAAPLTPPVTVPDVTAPIVLPTPTTGTPLDSLLDPLTQTVNKLLGVL